VSQHAPQRLKNWRVFQYTLIRKADSDSYGPGSRTKKQKIKTFLSTTPDRFTFFANVGRLGNRRAAMPLPTAAKFLPTVAKLITSVFPGVLLPFKFLHYK
jgi:hypothetical protein